MSSKPNTPRKSQRVAKPTPRKVAADADAVKKRKAVQETWSSDSDVEVKPALPKKAKTSTAARKKSPEVFVLTDSEKEEKDKLPPVSIRAKVPTISNKSPSKKLKFGSVLDIGLDDIMGSPPPADTSVAGRSTGNLENAIALTPKRGSHPSSSKPATPSPPKKKGSAKLGQINKTPTTPSPTKRNSPAKQPSKSLKKLTFKKKTPSPKVLVPDSDGDDEGEGGDGDDDGDDSLPESVLPRHMQQRAKRTGRPEPDQQASDQQASDQQMSDIEEFEDAADHESEEETAKENPLPVRKGKARQVSEAPKTSDDENPLQDSSLSSSERDDAEPEETGVLRRSRQDKMLYSFYDKIKFPLKEVIVEPAYVNNQKAPAITGYLDLQNIREKVDTQTFRVFMKALLFESHPPYVNPAFFDPKLLTVPVGKQYLQVNNQPAVFIMAGMGPACELINAATLSSKSKTQLVRQIGFLPVEQHWHIFTSTVGQKLSFKTARANLDGTIFNISTRPEKDHQEEENDNKLKAGDFADLLTASPSPSKKKSSKPKSGFHSPQNYPSSRAYEDGAPPIYDGRPRPEENYSGFKFKAEEFDDIRGLPVYAEGLEDIPSRSLVAVGYTANTYKKDAKIHLSGNIQFVILLGIME